MVAMTRRRCLGGGAALGAGFLAAACDMAESTGGEVVPDATQGTRPAIVKPPGVPNRTKQSVAVQVRLTPIGSYGGNTPDHRLTAPFTEEHPHITVEWHHWNVEQVAETSATGVLRDVLHFPWAEGRLWQDYVARLVTQGMLLGLNRFIRRDRYDLTDYWPGCLHASTWQDDLYALHTEVDTNLVFYNQELFAAAGVPVPTDDWTWDELLRYAHALTQPQGGYGFGLFTGYFFTIPWIWSNDSAVISADQTRSLVDQPQAQAALQWLAELRHTHAVWPPSGSPHVKARFEAGQLAMLYTLYGDYQHRLRYLLYPGPAFAYGVAVPPTQVAQPASWLWLEAAFQLGAATTVPDESWAFLSWWTGEAAQRTYHHGKSRQVGQRVFLGAPPPARRSLAAELVDWFGKPVLAALENARHVPLHPAKARLLDVYDAGMTPVWEGKQSVESATTAVADEQNAILAA